MTNIPPVEGRRAVLLPDCATLLTWLATSLLRALPLTPKEADVVAMTSELARSVVGADVTAADELTGVCEGTGGAGVSSLTLMGELGVGDSRPLSLALSTTAAARSEANDDNNNNMIVIVMMMMMLILMLLLILLIII